MKNYPITIETGEHAGETVWVHRSIAVAGLYSVGLTMNGVFLLIKEVKEHQTFKDIGTVLVAIWTLMRH